MKTKQNAHTKADLLAISKSDKSVLKHILSPLELCAWDKEYKAFTYKLDDISIAVSATDSMKIMAISTAKMDAFSLLIFKTRCKLTENKGQTRQQ